MPLTRRQILAALPLTMMARPGWAASPLLTVGTRVLDVAGRAATVFGITGPDGTSGLTMGPGGRLSGDVLNQSGGPLVLHWHGQVLAPFDQDRARPGGGALAQGATDAHDFELTPGTHWMHSHALSEQNLLAAPLICARPGELDMQNVTVTLHDFAFRPAEEILAALGAPGGHDMSAMASGGEAGHDMSAMATDAHAGHDMSAMAPGMVHANDVVYDAFLANDRTLDDPQVVLCDPGAPVRLRIINAATASAFWIDTGALPAQVVAVDGNPVVPQAFGPVPLAMGQRVDLIVTMPAAGGAFPVIAQVEALTARTGLILATPGAAIPRVAATAEQASPHLDLSLDRVLHTTESVPADPGRMVHVMLGQGDGYVWSINGQQHGAHAPLTARSGERLSLMFMNPTAMMHPMHLHGHHFQVTAIDGTPMSGPLRDTVIVPPGQTVTVSLTAGPPGDWYLHCHHLYHMWGGMMTELRVTA